MMMVLYMMFHLKLILKLRFWDCDGNLPQKHVKEMSHFRERWSSIKSSYNIDGGVFLRNSGDGETVKHDMTRWFET